MLEAGRRKYLVFALVLSGVLVAYANHHLNKLLHGGMSELILINALGFGWLAFSLIASHLHRDYNPTVEERQALGAERMTVVVPLYNEDPECFRRLLESLIHQTRLPQKVHIVENGVAEPGPCARVAAEYSLAFRLLDVEFAYIAMRQKGKRYAQVHAFDADPDADVFVTLDSDTVLDKHALAEGTYPFTDPGVTSVAGLLLSLNHSKNLLTRLIDLSFTSSFLNGRASWSRLGSVVVNCGGLAFYRASVVRKYRDKYLNQKVLGAHVMSGDDRMMTCYALLEGRTVIQEGSVGFTLQPENLWHLTRQRVRWARSFWWGSVWLVLSFPLRKPAFWLVLAQLVTFLSYSAAIPYVLVNRPTWAAAWILVWAMGLSYVRSIRYLVVKRSDQSRWSQWFTFALAPLGSLLMIYLSTVLYYVGLATVRVTGWSTRADGAEVGL
jgi:hyaluronan synthase